LYDDLLLYLHHQNWSISKTILTNKNLKCMRIKKLLLLSAFLTVSGGLMAQTTLTATNSKVVPGKGAQLDAKVSFEVPATIGGWQMELVLPEGISLSSEAGQFTIGESSADATLYPGVKASSLHKNHQIIGGETTGGSTLLVCIPTAKEEQIGTSGQLCTVKLVAAETFKGDKDDDKNRNAEVVIKSFVASDPAGATVYEIAEPVKFFITALLGDANGNGKVDMADAKKVKNLVLAGTTTGPGDANNNGKLDIADCRKIRLEVLMYE
jgi:hypothetical protein